MSNDAATRIPLIDLAAQQARIRGRIDAAVARVFDHGHYIMGPEVDQLERALEQFSGAGHCVTCSSGTDALLISMMALGVGPGDAVLCPAFTYTATPESIALLGATPVFVDVDPSSFNTTVDFAEAGAAAARKSGLRPVGLVAVDLFGLPADYASLESWASSRGLWIVADAAQSIGASRDGRKVGTFGTITAASFFPSKPLGCYGDGGAIFTMDQSLADAAASIRLHGRAIGGEKYDIERVGVNGRLDTIQAAILLEKLTIFPEEVESRQEIARRYSTGLSEHVSTPVAPMVAKSVWAQYTVRVEANNRAAVIAALRNIGVATAVYYPRPLHMQAAYREFPTAGTLANSELLCRQVLSLPMHPYLSTIDQDLVVATIKKAVG